MMIKLTKSVMTNIAPLTFEPGAPIWFNPSTIEYIYEEEGITSINTTSGDSTLVVESLDYVLTKLGVYHD